MYDKTCTMMAFVIHVRHSSVNAAEVDTLYVYVSFSASHSSSLCALPKLLRLVLKGSSRFSHLSTFILSFSAVTWSNRVRRRFIIQSFSDFQHFTDLLLCLKEGIYNVESVSHYNVHVHYSPHRMEALQQFCANAYVSSASH
jgi:hypothetical protein